VAASGHTARGKGTLNGLHGDVQATWAPYGGVGWRRVVAHDTHPTEGTYILLPIPRGLIVRICQLSTVRDLAEQTHSVICGWGP
jgi:hypothetical protein